MAVVYQNLNTSKITVTNPLTFGSGAAFTYYAWFRRDVAYFSTAVGTNKGSNDLLVHYNTGYYGAEVVRATTSSIITTATDIFPSNQWSFGCMTYSETNGARILKGSASTPAAEVTYSSQQVGSGSTAADSGDLWINNRGAAASSSLGGTLAVAAFFDREFTLGEIISHQYRPRSNSNCRVLYFPYQTTNIPDLSGNGRTGTGATLAVVDDLGPPIANPFGRTPGRVLRAAVGGGGGGGGGTSRNRVMAVL